MSAIEQVKQIQAILQVDDDGIWGKDSQGALDKIIAASKLPASIAHGGLTQTPVNRGPVFDKIGNVVIYKNDRNVISFVAGMQIDGDGGYRTYAPANNGLPALDYLANAGSPGNWYGVVTVNGVPVIQGPTDPAPGYYVSPTSFVYSEYKPTDPRRYVDSETVPFFVLPGKKAAAEWKVKLGTPGRMTNLQTGVSVNGFYADSGPSGKIGEASIAAAKVLGIPSSPKNGGTDDPIILYEVFT